MIICLNCSNAYTPFVQRVSLLLKNAFFLLYKGYLFSKKTLCSFSSKGYFSAKKRILLLFQRVSLSLKDACFLFFKGFIFCSKTYSFLISKGISIVKKYLFPLFQRIYFLLEHVCSSYFKEYISKLVTGVIRWFIYPYCFKG